MLDIPVQEQTQQAKPQERVNLRLNPEQLKALNEFCEKKNIKSRSKVVKAALDQALTGKSNIDFSENFEVDYSNESRKTLEFDPDKRTLTVCPHCNGKVRLDPEHYKKFRHTEIQKVKVLPSFIPAFFCSVPQCMEIHPNENYNIRPGAYCSNCGQFAKDNSRQVCVWCGKHGTLLQIYQFRLDYLGIPNPRT